MPTAGGGGRASRPSLGASDRDEPAVDYACWPAKKASPALGEGRGPRPPSRALARLDRMPDKDGTIARRLDAVLQQCEGALCAGRARPAPAGPGKRGRSHEQHADPPRRAAGTTGRVLFTWSREATPRNHYLLSGGRSGRGRCRCDELRAFVDSCLAQASDFRAASCARRWRPARAPSPFRVARELWWACRTLWELVVASMAAGDWVRGLDYCGRALGHGEATDDRRLRVGAVAHRTAHIQRGDPKAALGWCDRALALSSLAVRRERDRRGPGYGLARRGSSSGFSALQGRWTGSPRLLRHASRSPYSGSSRPLWRTAASPRPPRSRRRPDRHEALGYR